MCQFENTINFHEYLLTSEQIINIQLTLLILLISYHISVNKSSVSF